MAEVVRERAKAEQNKWPQAAQRLFEWLDGPGQAFGRRLQEQRGMIDQPIRFAWPHRLAAMLLWSWAARAASLSSCDTGSTVGCGIFSRLRASMPARCGP